MDGGVEVAGQAGLWARIRERAPRMARVMFTRARLAGDPGLRAWPPAFQARNFAGVPAVDKDPETYMHQAEQQLRPPAPGSLNVGSLKGQ